VQNRIAAGREGKKEESRAESNEFRADWLAVDSFHVQVRLVSQVLRK